MATVEQLLKDARAKKTRWDAARAAVLALPTEERGQFLAELMVEVGEDVAPAAVTTPKAMKTTSPAGTAAAPDTVKPEGSFSARAERLVTGHPEGISTSDVGKIIGQPTANADGTLRHIMEARKTIERREGLWFPTETPSTKVEKMTNRAAVIETLIASAEPLGAAEIFSRVLKIKPEAKKPSIDAELNRMRQDGLLAQKGSNSRGGLYGLTNGGAHVATPS